MSNQIRIAETPPRQTPSPLGEASLPIDREHRILDRFKSRSPALDLLWSEILKANFDDRAERKEALSTIEKMLFGNDLSKHPGRSTIPEEDQDTNECDQNLAAWSVHCFRDMNRTLLFGVALLEAIADARQRLGDDKVIHIADVGCGSTAIWGLIATLADPLVKVDAYEVSPMASQFAMQVRDRFSIHPERLNIYQGDVLAERFLPKNNYDIVISETLAPGLLANEKFVQISNVFQPALRPEGVIIPAKINLGFHHIAKSVFFGRFDINTIPASYSHEVIAGEAQTNTNIIKYSIDLDHLPEGTTGICVSTPFTLYKDLRVTQANTINHPTCLIWINRKGVKYTYDRIVGPEDQDLPSGSPLEPEVKKIELYWIPGAEEPSMRFMDAKNRTIFYRRNFREWPIYREPT